MSDERWGWVRTADTAHGRMHFLEVSAPIKSNVRNFGLGRFGREDFKRDDQKRTCGVPFIAQIRQVVRP